MPTQMRRPQGHEDLEPEEGGHGASSCSQVVQVESSQAPSQAPTFTDRFTETITEETEADIE